MAVFFQTQTNVKQLEQKIALCQPGSTTRQLINREG